jgi:regulator of sigma E protease
VSWALAIGALVALIILHELGHFVAAKAVGMRVERFSLFFGPVLAKFRRGETEYALSAVPLGGYVRITGQDPRKELPPELAARGYFAKPPWQRIVVIAAGPLANILVAIVVAWLAYAIYGQTVSTNVVAGPLKAPAAAVLRPGDRIVSIDGLPGRPARIVKAISSHRCAGRPTAGCRATTPVTMVIARDGTRRTLHLRPVYDPNAGRMRVGFAFAGAQQGVGPLRAVSLGESDLWRLTKLNFSALSHIFDSQTRSQLTGVVGTVDITHQLIRKDGQAALMMIALISIALAIVNLLPILPLDGGHILWAVLDWVRRRPVSVAVMERTALVGLVLIVALVVVVMSNDISGLQNGRLNVR